MHRPSALCAVPPPRRPGAPWVFPALLSLIALGCATAEPAADPVEKTGRAGVHLECVGALSCPIPPPFTVTRGYANRSDRGVHLAVDIDGEAGDAVLAACQGPIVFAGDAGGYGSAAGDRGPVVLQRCDDVGVALVALYGHCRAEAAVGTLLARGQRICRLSDYVGLRGANADHLHFGARLGAYVGDGRFLRGYADGVEDLAERGGAWVDPLSWRGAPGAGGCGEAERCHDGQCPSPGPLAEGARFLVGGGGNPVSVHSRGHRHPILDLACRALIDGPADGVTACVTRAVADALIEAPTACAEGAFVRVPGAPTVYRVEAGGTRALCGSWSEDLFREVTGYGFGAVLPVPAGFLAGFPPAAPGVYPDAQGAPACGQPSYACGNHDDPTGLCHLPLDCGPCACEPTQERAEVRCEGDTLRWFDDCGVARGALPCRHGCAAGACRAPGECEEGAWRPIAGEGCQPCVAGAWAAAQPLEREACAAQGCHLEGGPRWADLPDGTPCLGGRCLSGVCEAPEAPPAVCSPGEYALRGGRCERCDPTGTRWLAGAAPAGAECRSQVCDPARGLVWQDRDGACGAEGWCAGGACVEPPPEVCAAGRYALRAGECQQCSPDGTQWLRGGALAVGECEAQVCDPQAGPVWRPRDGGPCGAGGICAGGACQPADPPACDHGACAVRLSPNDNGVLEVLAAAYHTVDGQPLSALAAQGQVCAVTWAIGEPWHHVEQPVADADGDGWLSLRLPPLRAGHHVYEGCWRCPRGLPLRVGLRRCHPDLIAPEHYLSAGGHADDRAGDFYFRGHVDGCAEAIGFAVAWVDGRYVPAGPAASQICR